MDGLLGKSDPYVVVKFGTEFEGKTKVISKTLNPVWNADFRFLVKSSQTKYNVEFTVYDHDFNSKDDFIGYCETSVQTVLEDFKPKELTLKLTDPKGEHKTKLSTLGTITVRLTPQNRETVERHFWRNFASGFDTDNNKSLSYTELIGLLGQIGASADEKLSSELFERADTNHDNNISFDEFCDLMSTDVNNLHKNPILEKILPEGTMDFIWYASTQLDDKHMDVTHIMNKRGFYGTVTTKEDKLSRIMVHDRKSGKLIEEKIPAYILSSLRMMYQTGSGKFAVDTNQVKKVLKHLTENQRKKFEAPESKKEIDEFIKFHNLNTAEIKLPLDKFENFNQFFYRELKDGARPVANPKENKVAVSPADSRLNVFPTITEATKIWVKGKNFNLKRLLDDEKLAAEFDEGSLVIARLAPQDYHRFHSPVTGKLLDFKPFVGTYYTVNPIAVKEDVDVYTENKRTLLTIETAEFGTVLFIAVGATMVGCIEWTKKKGDFVNKGDELGYFAFGGSTVLLLFKKGTIQFDQDLLINSQKPVETLVAVGDSLGKATKA